MFWSANIRKWETVLFRLLFYTNSTLHKPQELCTPWYNLWWIDQRTPPPPSWRPRDHRNYSNSGDLIAGESHGWSAAPEARPVPAPEDETCGLAPPRHVTARGWKTYWGDGLTTASHPSLEALLVQYYKYSEVISLWTMEWILCGRLEPL